MTFSFLFIPVNDKSSVAGDPLTDPGEYENLPFHGMQSAPNKVSLRFIYKKIGFVFKLLSHTVVLFEFREHQHNILYPFFFYILLLNNLF